MTKAKVVAEWRVTDNSKIKVLIESIDWKCITGPKLVVRSYLTGPVVCEPIAMMGFDVDEIIDNDGDMESQINHMIDNTKFVYEKRKGVN